MDGINEESENHELIYWLWMIIKQLARKKNQGGAFSKTKWSKMRHN